MAAVAAPLSSAMPSPSGSGHRPLPLQNLSTDSSDWAQEFRALPTVPPPTSARMRQPPVSPVRVNFQPDNWARPSNGSIEDGNSGYQGASAAATEREPARSSVPPPPPLHRSQQAAQPAIGISPPPTAALGRGQDRDQSYYGGNRPSAASPASPARGSLENAAVPSPDLDLRLAKPSSRSQNATPDGGLERPKSVDWSAEGSREQGRPDNHSTPRLQFDHQAPLPRPVSIAVTASREQPPPNDARPPSSQGLAGTGATVHRNLTPTSQYGVRRTSMPRPHSSYSVYSDVGPAGRSPGLYSDANLRSASSQSRGSPDTRPSSYADMLSVPYPQPGPAPIALDNARLRSNVGSNASLLSVEKTLEMYRQNVKKTSDMSIQYSFAVFLISTAQEQGLTFDEEAPKRKGTSTPSAHEHGSSGPDSRAAASPTPSSPHELVREARHILQRLANSGYPFAQYYLADGYASGLFNKGKEDYHAAFPLFVLAAKHGHAESAYRTALCYEFGWGCRRDPTKAVQFLRSAASKRHPGAMTRLGKACLSGDLGETRYKEGIKWLKLATESADAIYNAAPYHLGCLYETGFGDEVFQDEPYAAELFTQAAELGHADANFRMGDAYEHGRLQCPRDPALSVHFYTGAAERGHPAAMMGLCAWYIVGAPPVLEKDEEEAYEWARRAADLGYVKAQYAVGYFTEMGIGCRRDMLEANVWYVRAADAGDERAKQRLAVIRSAVSGGGHGAAQDAAHGGKTKKTSGKDENCALM